MDWIPKDKYFAESGCGQYRISLAYVRGQAGYTTWHRGVRDKEAVWRPVVYTTDLAAAQRACEHHESCARKGKSTIRYQESGT
jgi:hypothetical protein